MNCVDIERCAEKLWHLAACLESRWSQSMWIELCTWLQENVDRCCNELETNDMIMIIHYIVIPMYVGFSTYREYMLFLRNCKWFADNLFQIADVMYYSM